MNRSYSGRSSGPPEWLMGGGGGGLNLGSILELAGFGTKERLANQTADLQTMKALFDMQQAQKEYGLKQQSGALEQRKLQEAISESLAKLGLSQQELGLKQKELEQKGSTSELQQLIEANKYETDPARRAVNSRAIAKLSPALAGAEAEVTGERNKQAATSMEQVLGPLYQKGNKKLLASAMETYKNASPDVMKLVDWPGLASKWGGGDAGATGGAGLVGLAYNAPTALQNVGKGVFNVLSRLVAGEHGPQVEYGKGVDPFNQVIDKDRLVMPQEDRAPVGGSGVSPIEVLRSAGYQPGAGFPRQMPPVQDMVDKALPFTYEGGGPSAMPYQRPEPGFLESLSKILSERSGYGGV